jgi:Ohr subfamily peroxiredoxin
MDTLYLTVVTATGGRNGKVRSDDGLLVLNLAMPRSLGGKGGATNPQQLFAAGYAACFGNAVISGKKDHAIKDEDVEVAANVGLIPNDSGGFTLDVTLTGFDLATAEAIADEAHQVCPHSNATRNVDVQSNVGTR